KENAAPAAIGHPPASPVLDCAPAEGRTAVRRRGFQTIQTNWTLFFLGGFQLRTSVNTAHPGGRRDPVLWPRTLGDKTGAPFQARRLRLLLDPGVRRDERE